MPSNPGWPCSASSPECLDYRCAPSCLVDRTHSEGVREVVAKISPGPSMDPVLLWGKARRRWSSDSVAGRGPGASWSAATFSHFLLYDSPRMDSLPGAGRVKGSLSFCPESAPAQSQPRASEVPTPLLTLPRNTGGLSPPPNPLHTASS